jgi:hypothetical protein
LVGTSAMNSPDFYRGKADECEREAGKAKSPDDKARWLKLAADWLALIPAALRRKPTPSEDFDALERARGTHQQKSEAEH